MTAATSPLTTPCRSSAWPATSPRPPLRGHHAAPQRRLRPAAPDSRSGGVAVLGGGAPRASRGWLQRTPASQKPASRWRWRWTGCNTLTDGGSSQHRSLARHPAQEAQGIAAALHALAAGSERRRSRAHPPAGCAAGERGPASGHRLAVHPGTAGVRSRCLRFCAPSPPGWAAASRITEWPGRAPPRSGRTA